MGLEETLGLGNAADIWRGRLGRLRNLLCQGGQGGRGRGANEYTFGPNGDQIADKGVWMAVFVAETVSAVLKELGLQKPEAVVEELATRWHRGRMVLHPADPALQPKEVPLEVFFHKIVMIRNNLRVLEITFPPTNMPWGVREMHLRHPDGHVFRVGTGTEEER